MKKTSRIGKRAITLLLSLLMVFSVIPPSIFVVAESGIPFSDMEVGVLYFAEFNYNTQWPDIYLYGDGTGTTMYESTEMKSEFPQSLTVMRQRASDTMLYVTNTDWPSRFSAYRYLDPAELIILSKCEPDVPDDGLIYGEVGLEMDGKPADAITVKKGEKLSVFTTLSAEIGSAVTYQWQMKSPDGEWADILYYVEPYVVISDALILNALNSSGVAYVRCIVTDGELRYASGDMAVTLIENAVSAFSSPLYGANPDLGEERPRTEEEETQAGSSDAFQVAIQYLFLHANPADPTHNGSTAAETFTLSFGKGDYYTGEIISPPIPGYKPYRELRDGEAAPVGVTPITYCEKTLYPADVYPFTEQREKVVLTVYYVPQTVTYRIKYFKQNLQDDNYTDWKTVYVTDAIPDTFVGKNLDPAEIGFSPLAYDEKTLITRDGEAVVEIYYDRIYYLVKYDITKEGYGVMPNYVRYGTTVMLGNPTNPGYTFDEWELTSVKDTPNGEELISDSTVSAPYKVTDAYSQITVAHNLVYTAKWIAQNVSYTVIYWRENENDNGFSIWKTETVTGNNVKPGAVIDVSSRRISGVSATESQHFTYNETLSDKEVIVKGDNTAAANIYYTRNFYYILFTGTNSQGATQCRLQEHTHGENCCSIEGCDHTSGMCRLETYCGYDHVHVPACNYRKICEKEPHTHTQECWLCEEHTHDNNCYKHTLNCFSTRTNQLKAPGNNNNYTANINNPQNGYVYRYRRNNNTYYNYFYFNGTWYDVGTSNSRNTLSNTYGISVDSNLSNPTSNGSYTATEANTTNSCNCSLTCGVSEEHTHGDGNCSYKDEAHKHTSACYKSDCDNAPGHEHVEGCYQQCIIYPHTHSTGYQNNCSTYLHTITAKYNADISEIWPTSEEVDDWRAWGWLNNNVYYERWGSSYVTKRIEMINAMCTTTGNKTTTYQLGSQTSRGGTTVMYMFESIEQTPGENKVLHTDGRYYEEKESYTQEYIHSTELDPKDIVGMSCSQDGVRPTNGVITFYYTRNSYNLIFVNSEVQEKNVSVKYGKLLGDLRYTPDIPVTAEENSVNFAGWYTTQICADGTEFNFETDTMPARTLYLYAKWVPTTWRVEVYLDEEKTIPMYDGVVEFGSMIAEPKYAEKQETLPEYKDLIFNGWYYTEGGKDVRFDFNTMAIKHEYVIFAKWTSRVPINYTVRYVIENADGTYTDISDPARGASLVGATKTFTARIANELYSGYQKYLPIERTKSKEMSSIESENVIFFMYRTVLDLTYTVHHKFISEEFNSILGQNTFDLSWSYTIHAAEDAFSGRLTIKFDVDLEEKVKAQANGNALWEIVTTLSPDLYRQDLILTAPTEAGQHLQLNEILFTWEDRGAIFMYQELHCFQDVDDPRSYTSDIVSRTGIGTYDKDGNSTISGEHDTDIQGFVPNTGKSTMTASYKKDDGKERILVFYYDRVTYNYQVQYKYGNNLIADSVSGTARYEQEITVEAKVIPGYTVDGASTKTEKITFDGQIITFYYAAEKVIFNYSIIGGVGGSVSPPQEVVYVGEVAKGSIPTPFSGYAFLGWFTDASGTVEVDSSLVNSTTNKLTPIARIEDADQAITYYAMFGPTSLTIRNNISRENNEELPERDQVFVYVIQGQGDVSHVSLRISVSGIVGRQTVYGLPFGSYTVTVENGWSWRYSDANGQSVVITAENGTEELTFTYGLQANLSGIVGDSSYYSTN